MKHKNMNEFQKLWLLQNVAKKFSIIRNIPRSILLIGLNDRRIIEQESFYE